MKENRGVVNNKANIAGTIRRLELMLRKGLRADACVELSIVVDCFQWYSKR